VPGSVMRILRLGDDFKQFGVVADKVEADACFSALKLKLERHDKSGAEEEGLIGSFEEGKEDFRS